MNTKPARRQFVQAATAAIATARFPILGANDRIQLGQVGLGGRGNDHIGFYTSLDSDCRYAAVGDVNQAPPEPALGTTPNTKAYPPNKSTAMPKRSKPNITPP